MATIYRIHPGIGIARLGNSPDEFCISPEEPAALPLACDSRGNPLLSPDGQSEVRVNTFKDGEGRIKRQAARFGVWAYDEQSPEGRPLKLGDPIAGGGNDGVLVDIQWRVYVANKKSSWYEFRQLDGEHGYTADHPRRNADVTDAEARQQLIIDPGPRAVDCSGQRSARFDRDGGGVYAATFPPPLEPCSIDTLGEIMTDDTGRLLVLGGRGHSGTFKAGTFGQPRIDTYANNDGWFDDTADGPVTARLVMFSKIVQQLRFVDVQAPAWVVVGYPAYVPQILDIVTAEDVLQDLAIRQFAGRTDLYGEAGTFDDPQVIDPTDTEALIMWRAGRLTWNAEHRPWFYRDIWPILFRPDEFTYLTSVLGQSNYPHNQSPRGNFDPYKLSVPPQVDRHAVEACERQCLARHESGELFMESLLPVLAPAETRAESQKTASAHELLDREIGEAIRAALATFARAARGGDANDVTDFDEYLRDWRTSSTKPGYPEAKQELARAVDAILAGLRPRMTEDLHARLRSATLEHLRRYETGQLLDECRRKCVEASTHDPYRGYRRYL
ncbi:MAG: LodA/GoxA family CTQ-dependent oxidase, partial [Candidatus Rokuibacteriota bacterium]